jgi:hypothetical protein
MGENSPNLGTLTLIQITNSGVASALDMLAVTQKMTKKGRKVRK